MAKSTTPPTPAEEWLAAQVEQAEATLAGARRKVEKLDEHRAGAVEAVATAEAELAAAQALTVDDFVEPTEHVRATVQ